MIEAIKQAAIGVAVIIIGAVAAVALASMSLARDIDEIDVRP